MTLAQQFDADVAAIEPEVPVSFKWHGIQHPASRTPIMDRQAMEDAGFSQAFDFQLVVRTSIFVAPVVAMRVNDMIEIFDPLRLKWMEYNCQTVDPSQDGVTITYAVKQRT